MTSTADTAARAAELIRLSELARGTYVNTQSIVSNPGTVSVITSGLANQIIGNLYIVGISTGPILVDGNIQCATLTATTITTAASLTITSNETTHNGNMSITGTTSSYGQLILGINQVTPIVNTAGTIKLWAAGDTSNYTTITAGDQSATASINYTLPITGTVGNTQIMQCSLTGVMSWTMTPQVTSLKLGEQKVSHGTLTIYDEHTDFLASFTTGTMLESTQYVLPLELPDAGTNPILTSTDAGVMSWTLTPTMSNVTLGVPGPAGVTGQIIMYNAANADSLTIQPGATAPATVFTLPVSAPASAGSLLTSAVNGTLSWSFSPTVGTVTAMEAGGFTSGLQFGTNVPGYIKLMSAGSNQPYYTSFIAGDQTALAANLNYTLPITAPISDNDKLVSTPAGVMSWYAGNYTMSASATTVEYDAKDEEIPISALYNSTAGGMFYYNSPTNIIETVGADVAGDSLITVSAAHGLVVGDKVWIHGTSAGANIDGFYEVKAPVSDVGPYNFTIAVATAGGGALGKVYKYANAITSIVAGAPATVTTVGNHFLSDGDVVVLTGTGDAAALGEFIVTVTGAGGNDKFFITSVTAGVGAVGRVIKPPMFIARTASGFIPGPYCIGVDYKADKNGTVTVNKNRGGTLSTIIAPIAVTAGTTASGVILDLVIDTDAYYITITNSDDGNDITVTTANLYIVKV